MTIPECTKKKLIRIRLKEWNEQAYLELHLTDAGFYGPWAKLVDPPGQKSSGVEVGSQAFLFANMPGAQGMAEVWTNPNWEEFTGTPVEGF
jgi:hypothetical protein